MAITAGHAHATTEDAEHPHDEARDADGLADTYIRQFVRRGRLAAENEFHRSEAKRLATSADVPDKLPGQLAGAGDESRRRRLLAIVQRDADRLVENLSQQGAAAGEQLDELTSRWREVRRELAGRELLLYEAKATRQFAGKLAFLMSVDNRWFWLFALLAIGALVALALHDRRHEVRKMLYGGRAQEMGMSKLLAAAALLLLGLTLTAFFFGDGIYAALMAAGAGEEISPRDRVAEEISELDRDIARLESKQESLSAAHLQALDAQVAALERTLPGNDAWSAAWKQSRRRVAESTVNLAVGRQVAESLTRDTEALAAVESLLQSESADAQRFYRIRRWIRGLLGLALVGLTAACSLAFWLGYRRRQRVTADTCPLCLATGTLRKAARRKGREMVECDKLIAVRPQQRCGYTFPARERPITKLCIPTLGIVASGKTHWLAMVYRQLGEGNFQHVVTFDRNESTRSEQFDRIVDDVLAKIGTSATQRDRIPHPLIFNFTDRDRWLGRSHVLANVFDYSGEVLTDTGAKDYRRQRALDAQGYVFVLDPTAPAQPQANALVDFRDDLQAAKQRRAGRALRIPFALCVSKIDLLPNQPFAAGEGRAEIDRFYRELAQVDPGGEEMSTRVVKDRSKLCASLRKTIWPEWDVEQQIGDLFGGRVRYFPLSSVGLDTIGETDPQEQTISPFGILEPLLWLLHMNGYPVLD